MLDMAGIDRPYTRYGTSIYGTAEDHRAGHDGHQKGHYASRKDRPTHIDSHDLHRHENMVSGTKSSGRALQNKHFVSDVTGDPDVRQYGSNNSYRIPLYRRIGRGLILGLPRNLKVDRQRTTDKSIVLVDSAGHFGTRNKAVFGKTGEASEYRIVQMDTVIDDLSKDFLSFGHYKAKSGFDSSEDSDSTADQNAMGYRSIKGKTKATDFLDDGLEPNLQQNEQTLEIQSQVERELQRLVDSDPSNGQSWLNLINEKFRHSESNSTHSERLSNADIKISMYEKALKHVVDASKECLLLGLLSEASLVWDRNKLQKKWQDTLQSNKESFMLWRRYLNYVQTNPVRFKFDDLKDIYKECFKIFKEVVNRHDKNNIEQQGRQAEANLIYLLLRFTICLKQAGYVEQAIALWQANLELTFCNSPDLAEAALESFWESEVARIGETGALGLDHYCSYGGDPLPEATDLAKPDVEGFGISTWLSYEQQMSDVLPARTMDTTDDEDASRIVLYSDVEPYLLNLTEGARHNLLDAAFLFCGLPALWQGSSRDWALDEFIHHGIPLVSTDSKIVNGLQSSQSPMANLASCVMTRDVLFARPSSSSSVDQKSQTDNMKCIWPHIDRLPSGLDWIHNVLKHLVMKATITDRNKLEEYYLAFELNYFPEQVRKSSKSILKLHPQDLKLYNTHALIEYRLGNNVAATRVLQTAMKMRPEDPNIIALKRTMVWESMENDKTSTAFEILLENSQRNDEAAIFQTQQNLLRGRDMAVAGKTDRDVLTAYVDCLILLTYLSNHDPLKGAEAVFESNLSYVSKKVPRDSEAIEVMHQNMTRLLQHHMSHQRQYKPAAIREVVRRSILAFPTNPIFLELWQRNERRYRIHDRVRSVVNDILSDTQQNLAMGNTSPLAGHLFAIGVEMQRAQEGSGSESVRSAFEKALNGTMTRNSPVVWSHYIHFELSRDDATSKIRNLIARSILACPWILNFHLLAVKLISDVERKKGSNFSESRRYYDAIVDRELRVHTLLESRRWK